MRRSIIAGNWKMNKTFSETEDFFLELSKRIDEKELKDIEVIICPPAIYLEISSDFARDYQISIGAQNVSEHKDGAYTGEISASMLRSMDMEYCIVGHSERRGYFAETNNMINTKIKLLLDSEIIPIVCIGESKEQRDQNITQQVIIDQLEGAFKEIELLGNIVIAYEPIWAIGTGETATPQQAQDVHKSIREWVSDKYSGLISDEVHILYGGSMKPENIEELMKQPDIDGGLIGGASLIVDKLEKMIDVVIELGK